MSLVEWADLRGIRHQLYMIEQSSAASSMSPPMPDVLAGFIVEISSACEREQCQLDVDHVYVGYTHLFVLHTINECHHGLTESSGMDSDRH